MSKVNDMSSTLWDEYVEGVKERGYEDGMFDSTLRDINNVMSKLNLSLEEALELLDVDDEMRMDIIVSMEKQ